MTNNTIKYEYKITLLFPSGRYSDDGKWYNTEREHYIEAESLEEAKSIAEKNLSNNEYDAFISVFSNELGDLYPIPPYISSVKLGEDD